LGHHAGVSDTDSDTYAYYRNGSLIASNSNGNHSIDGPVGFCLGSNFNGVQASDCAVSFLLVWDRVLDASEVKFVYDTYKTRLNLT